MDMINILIVYLAFAWLMGRLINWTLEKWLGKDIPPISYESGKSKSDEIEPVKTASTETARNAPTPTRAIQQPGRNNVVRLRP